MESRRFKQEAKIYEVDYTIENTKNIVAKRVIRGLFFPGR